MFMLKLFASGVFSLWLEAAGIKSPTFQPSNVSTASALLLGQDPVTATVVKRYLQQLSAKGFSEAQQGVWIQSGNQLLATQQGSTPLPAASLTKVATSLVALQTWGPQHQFITQIGTTGAVQKGILKGDLVVQGVGDPLFIWEEAINLGNTLNRIGIRQVTGDLVIVGGFTMNYESDPMVAGNLLREGLNVTTWGEEAQSQYSTMPRGTLRPQVVIQGNVQLQPRPPVQQRLLVRHRSLPLSQLLKQMNIYSNNAMAETLAASLGGAEVVAQRAAIAADVPQSEIQLINGSGLGTANRMSPRAACGMFQAIERQLQPFKLTAADFFPVAGRDRGTLEARQLPPATVVKTGTLADVSTLAGVIPTRKYGPIWFSIMNRGDAVDDFRVRQDLLLQNLRTHWGTTALAKEKLQPNLSAVPIGAGERDEILLPAKPPS